MFLKDPITKKPSLTITALVLCLIFFFASLILLFVGVISDYKISIVILSSAGLFLACYQQKRIKINFTGIEVSHDQHI